MVKSLKSKEEPLPCLSIVLETTSKYICDDGYSSNQKTHTESVGRRNHQFTLRPHFGLVSSAGNILTYPRTQAHSHSIDSVCWDVDSP